MLQKHFLCLSKQIVTVRQPEEEEKKKQSQGKEQAHCPDSYSYHAHV